MAEYDEAEGVLALWTSTQIPDLVRTGLADCLDFPENRIRVLARDVGGGFGIKGNLFPEVINPLIVDGQVQGGVAQGISSAILE